MPGLPVIRDLNNDGKLDLVITISTGVIDLGKIAVLLGNGNGGFTQTSGSPFNVASSNVGSAMVGDFNEDGKQDIALAGSPYGVAILPGDGTGNFAPPINSGINNLSLYSFVVADFNGDGHLDVVGPNYANNFVVLLGNGAGSFAAPITVTAPQPLFSVFSISTGDANKDGKPDLALAGPAGVTIMLGNGAGGFTSTSTYAVQQFRSTSAVFADFNEDGKIDLAVGEEFSVSLLYGDGMGSFEASLGFSTKVAKPQGVVVSDFNNDGKKDFAVVSSELYSGASGIEVSLGDGNGNFTAMPLIRFYSGTRLSSIIAADFNNDGNTDLAVTLPQNGTVVILLGDGAGGFATGSAPGGYANPPTVVNNLYGYPSNIKAGDLNNDGKIDLVVMTPNSNRFSVLLGDGTGNFTAVQGQTLGTGSYIDDLAIADFNTDGKQDLAVVRSGQNTVYVLPGLGNGNFASPAALSIAGAPVSIIAADFNNDGKPDLAISNSYLATIAGHSIQQYYVSVFINNDKGGFNPKTDYPVDGAGLLATGDFNTDGKKDLAMTSGYFIAGGSLKGVAILSGDGAGGFGSAITFSAGTNSSYLAVGDFNSDNKDDVIFSQTPSNSLALLLNNFSAALPCLAINDVTVTEGNSGTADAVFTVRLSEASPKTVRVNYFFDNQISFGEVSSAKNGADFQGVPGTLTFLPGTVTQTITVPVNGDLTDEFDEAFNVRLTAPINAAISDGNGLGVIIDNDSPPTVTINDVTIPEGNSNIGTTGRFTVSLSAISEKPISVQYTFSDGTAIRGKDYVAASPGTVSIPAGVTTANIDFSVNGNATFEPDKTFFVNLSAAINATIADPQGQATIANDDPLPGITIADASLFEGSSGTNNASFNVKLSNPSYQTITVNYATANATATAGNDYAAASGTVTFSPGETTKSIPVQIVGDSVNEPDEIFYINLANPTNARIDKAQGVETILNDDKPFIGFSNTRYTVSEGAGSALITVMRSGDTSSAASVDFATIDNVARQRSDYTLASGTLSFIGGEVSKTFSVLIIDNAYVDGSRSLRLTLSNPIGSALSNASQSLLTITDNDVSTPTTNPIDDAGYFVRQQYLDFLNRTPDDGGFAFWSSVIAACSPTDQQCINSKRVTVSAAFFIEQEFQLTGNYVYRMYTSAFAQKPTYTQFMPDRARINPDANQIEFSKQQFADVFVQRSDFLAKYPLAMTPAAFVDALIATVKTETSGAVDLSAQRQALIDAVQAKGRGSVARQIAEDKSFQAAEYNKAFVLMQYFGYLRRDPDQSGYDFWLDVLNNRVANNYRGMVCAFITSAEYQDRFSSVRTRNDSICGSIGP